VKVPEDLERLRIKTGGMAQIRAVEMETDREISGGADRGLETGIGQAEGRGLDREKERGREDIVQKVILERAHHRNERPSLANVLKTNSQFSTNTKL